MRKCLYILGLMLVSWSVLFAQERVYVSTDKDVYVAGENLWCSVYCIDAATGEYSKFSEVAYLQFVSNDGIAATHKVALIEGRGCGVFQIPVTFATGNYSIVSYTKAYGGDAKNEFNGKIITVLNTVSAKRVREGVAVGELLPGDGKLVQSGNASISVGSYENGSFPVKVKNSGGEQMKLSVSVYHIDDLTKMVGNYNSVPLSGRSGDFEQRQETDYAGEVVRVRVSAKNGVGCAGKYVYMSAVGNTEDVYVNRIDSSGVVTFYTNSIMGHRDLVFEVLDDSKSVSHGASARDTAQAYKIEILESEFKRSVAKIPQLRISRQMDGALRERNRRMQISRMFEADTLLDIYNRKDNSFVGDTKPLVYNLDEYTRFENLEETLREYVKFARIRYVDSNAEIKVVWGAQGRCLALVDGIPVSDHTRILGLNQQLIKQIAVYPKRYMLNHFIYDGIVNFITYRGDMAGMKLPANVSLVEYNGVSWPMAFLGVKTGHQDKYPNFNSTVYWNPTVEIPAGGEFEFNCVMPKYKGTFRVVIEGLQDTNKEVFAVEEFNCR
jgi:hypothetical protein